MLEAWLASGVVIAATAAIGVPWLSRRRALLREWRRLGNALDATMHEEPGTRVMRVRLGLEDVDVRLIDGRVLDITIRCNGASHDLAWTRRRVQSGGTATGDQAFDRRVEVFGPRPMLMSLLDDQARREIARAVDLGAELRHRELRLTWEAHPREVPAQLGTVIQTALRAATRSATVEHADSARLARAANFDPNGHVRGNALRELIGLHRPSAELEVVLQRALGDADIDVVAVAAMALGDDGLDLVRQLITDPDVQDTTRTELVQHVLGDARAAGCPPDRYLALRRLADDCSTSVHLKIRQAGAAVASEVRPARKRTPTSPSFRPVRKLVG